MLTVCAPRAALAPEAAAEWSVCHTSIMPVPAVTVCCVSALAIKPSIWTCRAHILRGMVANATQAPVGLDVMLPFMLSTEQSVDPKVALSDLLNTLHGAIGQRIHRIPAAHELFTLASQVRAD